MLAGGKEKEREGQTHLSSNDLEVVLPRVLAHAVVDALDAVAASEGEDLVDDALLGVVDDVVRAILARQRRLFLGGHGANDGGAQVRGHLAEEQADTAGGGVDEDGVALLERVRLLDECPCCHDTGSALALDAQFQRQEAERGTHQ